MIKLSIYGKGGIGKSTIACNLSAVFARRGLSVLQIGCDPKRDSVSRLVGGRPVPTVLQQALDSTGNERPFLVEGLWGIGCVEAGGPSPGIGCAGRGIDLALDHLAR